MADIDATRINESARRDFEKAMAENADIDLAEFLPAVDSADFTGTLRELVIIDMELKWQRLRENGPVVESYVERFRQLDTPANLTILLEEECRARLQAGNRPTVAEYQSRQQALSVPETDVSQIIASHSAASGSDAREEHSAPAASFGDYRIRREIGRGGMGVVYEAEQVALGRRVALKVLPQNALKNAELVARFEREARAAANLHHTNIVPVFGVGQDNGQHFYAMQFIQGYGLDCVLQELRQERIHGRGTSNPASSIESPSVRPTSEDRVPSAGTDDVQSIARSLLAGELARTVISDVDHLADETFIPASDTIHDPVAGPSVGETRLSGSSSLLLGSGNDTTISSVRRTLFGAVARIGVQTADALDYAHRRGILHRDIKPANLILDETGTVWITDFGLARIESEENLTRTGDVMGTLRYMPPEALEGRHDNRSDIFSLGLTLYELLCLKSGYDEGDRNRLIQRITDASVTSIREIETSIPRDLETIVHKCIDREPSGRYQTAGALRDDLERFLNDEPIQARRISGWEHLRRWARKNKGIAASLVVIASILLFVAVGSSIAAARFNTLVIEKSGETVKATAAMNLAEQREEEATEQRELAIALATASRKKLYFSEMLTAGATMKLASGTGYVRQILGNWDNLDDGPDLRGWEWYYLYGQCYGADATLGIDSHGSDYLHWSKDGDNIWYLSDWGQSIVTYDLHGESGRRIPLGLQLNSAAWSPDEKRVAVGCWDKTLRIYKWPAWELETVQSVGNRISRFSWSTDGKWLACAAFNSGRLTIHKGIDGEIVTEKLGLWNDPAIAFHPSRSQIAFADKTTVAVIDVESGAETARFPTLRGATTIAWSPEGDQIALKSRERLRILDSSTGTTISDTVLAGFAKSMVWHSNGRIAIAARDGNAYVVSAKSARVTHRLRGHNWRVESVQWSPSGDRLVTAGPEERPHLWPLDSLPDDKHIPAAEHTSVSWSPDSQKVMVLGFESLQFWDVNHGREDAERSVSITSAELLISASWSPDGQTVACLDDHGRVLLIDLNEAETVRTLHEGSESPLQRFGETTDKLNWSKDGRHLAAITGTHEVTAWDMRSESSATLTIEPNETVLSVVWHPSEISLAIGSTSHARIWDVTENQSRKFFNGWINSIGWSPDGDRLLKVGGVESRRFDVCLVDPTDLQPELAFSGATRKSNSYDWSPDGSRLAAGCNDGTVCIWDVESRILVARFADFETPCIGVRWSPDGTRLASVTNQEIIIKDARR